jgi:hypothetical protein
MSRADTIKAGWLAALAACFTYCELGIVNASFFRAGGPLPWAVAFDFLVTLPAAYAWFVLRPSGRPLLELAPFLLFSIACASLWLRHVPALQLPLHVFLAVAELALLTLFARRIAAALQQGAAEARDLVFQAQQQRELWLRVIALELCVVHYAFRWRPSETPAGAQRFDNHAPAQRLLLALAVISVMEAVPLHFLLHAWKPMVAWVVLAITLYSLCWITALYRALAARPHLLLAERLVVRVGLFYTAFVERSAIVRVELYDEPDANVVSLKVVTRPNVLLELASPVEVHGPFGRKRNATRLAFYAEQPDALLQLQPHPRRDPQQEQ